MLQNSNICIPTTQCKCNFSIDAYALVLRWILPRVYCLLVLYLTRQRVPQLDIQSSPFGWQVIRKVDANHSFHVLR